MTMTTAPNPLPDDPRKRYVVQRSFDGGTRWTTYDAYSTPHLALARRRALQWASEAVHDNDFYQYIIRVTDRHQNRSVLEITVDSADPEEARYAEDSEEAPINKEVPNHVRSIHRPAHASLRATAPGTDRATQLAVLSAASA